MRPVIIKHKWWRFWRRSFWGLNPWRWDVLRYKECGEMHCDGYSAPNDGGGGAFAWSEPVEIDESKKVYVPHGSTDGDEGVYFSSLKAVMDYIVDEEIKAFKGKEGV